MEEIANLFHGFSVVLQPFNLLVMLVGIMLGVIIGVLPGLGGANGVAILLPLTFSMSPTSAIIMLSCIYWGALFGGAITSILFNIPGEPWSVATTFDGHPLAQQGKADEALTAAFTSSFVGALVAVIMITFLAPLIAKFALQFGPAEFFSVYFLTFASFVGMGRGSPFKVLASMCLGFARDVEEDRSDRAAEQRPPVDAGEHHDGRGRIHGEGERQQDRDPVGTPQARQHADEDAEHEAHHHQGEDLPGQQDAETVDEKAECLHRPSVRTGIRSVPWA